mgnify:CR=1 FL=1
MNKIAAKINNRINDLKDQAAFADQNELKLIGAEIKFLEGLLINVNCFKIEDVDGKYKWHRINNGKIARNTETGRYERIESLLEKKLIRGIADESGEMCYIYLQFLKSNI